MPCFFGLAILAAAILFAVQKALGKNDHPWF